MPTVCLSTMATAPKGDCLGSMILKLTWLIWLQVLYQAGARKVMFLGSGPLGCVPGALAAAGVTNGQCVQSWNDIGQAYNAALEQFVYSSHETFPDMKAIVGKPFKQIEDFIMKGEKYGKHSYWISPHCPYPVSLNVSFGCTEHPNASNMGRI